MSAKFRIPIGVGSDEWMQLGEKEGRLVHAAMRNGTVFENRRAVRGFIRRGGQAPPHSNPTPKEIQAQTEA